MVSTKRVILANGPRLLREMLRRVLNKTSHIKVVWDVMDDKDLSRVIEELDPEWVIVSTPFHAHSHHWIEEYPRVRFLFLSPHENQIKMKWETSYEENYSDLSLQDFIHILEKDLQRT
jgi:hypothetical protein